MVLPCDFFLHKEVFMKKNCFLEAFVVMLQALMIAGITIFAVAPVSCKLTPEGIHVSGGDFSAPELLKVTVIDEKTVELDFSEAVTVKTAVVSPYLEDISDSSEHSKTEDASKALRAAGGDFGKIVVSTSCKNEGKSVLFNFAQPSEIGKQYEIFGVLEDFNGNSLTFTVGFTGYNPELPDLIMTEVQFKYEKASLARGVEYRCEFVEFLALSDGNLAGLRLESAADGEGKSYDFPNLKVKKGEVFTVHLRTGGDPEKCTNEDADDLNLSTERFSCNGIRDLWSSNTSARLNDSADVLFLLNKSTGKILDGLIYRNSSTNELKPELQQAVLKLEQAGIYTSASIENAAVTDKNLKASATKSLQRKSAKEIQDALMGNQKINMPVVSESGTWEIKAVTAGIL